MISHFQWVRRQRVLCTGLIKWKQNTSSPLVLMWSLSSSNLIQLVGGIHFLVMIGLSFLFPFYETCTEDSLTPDPLKV